ncbi:hypothetical protein, partial [Rhodococcus sp. EPR-147]|uniref:hypothetical protein n=1 Tax=Rhodococcus sp. EPR-147 TaxID=1813676 RepID=UPI001E2F5023
MGGGAWHLLGDLGGANARAFVGCARNSQVIGREIARGWQTRAHLRELGRRGEPGEAGTRASEADRWRGLIGGDRKCARIRQVLTD